ncbi:Os07g0274180 [Oryza sativa Japonica Group]|uniref:Os07g0274180 protein n=1 Tax=Oryza sativa subsp. japonica TaxID=39947 RepID=A0A0P0X529_ORYSJ|nr:Os07g0274180 [Oryza sativa Japonica Group]
MEMVKKAITNYAHKHAAINHDYRVSVNRAENKMHEEASKNTIRLMNIFATVCNNRSTRLGKQMGTTMYGATSTTSMPSTAPSPSNNVMTSFCADTHITSAETPKKVALTKRTAKKHVSRRY